MRRGVLTIIGCIALTACAAQQQAAIPPSPTGCYYREPVVYVAGIPLSQPRYTPAPCNVVNARRPFSISIGGGGSVPPNFGQPAQVLSPPSLPPLGGGGAWSMAGPSGAAAGAGGAWAGAGPGWAGGGAGVP